MSSSHVPDELIDRLSTETGQRLANEARRGRKRALSRISHFVVTVTHDGVTTRELTFEAAPTLRQIADQAGDDAFIVAIGMKRKSLRERFRLRIAAE